MARITCRQQELEPAAILVQPNQPGGVLQAENSSARRGKQVAVLAPTTILVEQHRHTFDERLADYPVRIAALSRFRTPSEQARITSELAGGELDIVIGTHRLLSSDVEFKDLGLLIIDEEQKFGVSAKEKLRSLSTNVDTAKQVIEVFRQSRNEALRN